MAGEVHRYRVVNSVVTSRRYTRAGIWFHKWKWVNTTAQIGFAFALTAMLTTGIAYWIDRLDVSWGLLWAIIIGFILGAFFWLYANLQHIERSITADMGESWDCEISENTWSHQRQDGTRVSIPWTIMEIEFTHRDAFLTKYGRDHVWVIRKPLQDAGLEDIFLEKISKKPEE